MKKRNNDEPQQVRQPSLPIIGGLILFTLILGVTKFGFIPVPTEAKVATIMHLPTILASLLEGWPAGVVVGTVFGLTSMYIPGTPMGQDPLVALVPRMIIGVTPYLTYMLMRHSRQYVRWAVAAAVGTLTNTCGYLVMAVVQGYLTPKVALGVAIKHGIPEVLLAVVMVIPMMIIMRKAQTFLAKHH